MRPRLWLLGGARLGDRDAGRPLPMDRRGGVLAVVSLVGGWVDRDRLATLFWPESSELAAKRNLRQLVWRVRRLDLEPPLEATAAALRWDVATDVAAFERALDAGDVRAAVETYGGSLLAGFSTHDTGDVAAFVERERQRLHERFHGAVLAVSRDALSAGDADAAAHMLRRLLDEDPFAEDVLQTYLRALLHAGRRHAAKAAYDRFVVLAERELGVAPLASTRAVLGDGVEERPAASGALAQGAALAHRPRLVGRDAERGAVERADTAFVVVSGEPGAGKTRLLAEAVPDPLWVTCSAGLQDVPYWPFVVLVRGKSELVERLGSYRRDLARLTPEVDPDVAASTVEPRSAKLRLTEALALLVERSGAPLVVDDLQWADAATLELLLVLAERGVRVYGTFRSDETNDRLVRFLEALAMRGRSTIVALRPLSGRDTRRLVEDLTESRAGCDALATWVHHRSGGNPFFAIETVRAFLAAGTVPDAAASAGTDPDVSTPDWERPVPPKVADVVRRRVERLPPTTRRVLEAAALHHGSLDLELLARVSGSAPFDVADALDEGERLALLDAGAFRHDLVRQTVAEAIPAARRRLLHRSLAEALEGVADDGVVAEHWHAAAEAVRARQAWFRAADALRTRGLPGLAVELLERTLDRADGAVDRPWLALALAEALREANRPAEASAIVDELLAQRPVDPELHLRSVLAKGTLLVLDGRFNEAQALLEAAKPLAMIVDQDELRFDHVMLRAHAAQQGLRPDVALELLEPELANRRGMLADVRFCQLLSSVGVLRMDSGRTLDGLATLEEARALAKALDARYLQVDVALNLLFCYSELHRFDDADALAQETLALGRYDNVPIFRNNLASLYFEAGRFRDALEQYRALAVEGLQAWLRGLAHARCAEATAAIGRRDGVLASLDAALDELPDVDVPAALGRIAIAVMRLGTSPQVDRLLSIRPDLRADDLPEYQREAFEASWAHLQAGAPSPPHAAGARAVSAAGEAQEPRGA